MTKQLTVKDEILIKATTAKVWEVLTKPKHVRQWDELPDDYPEEDMTLGSKVVWDLPNGGQSITTIVKAEEQKELKIALNVTNWEIQPAEGDVAYVYQLEERGNDTLLKIEIGDFSLIKDGKMYYDASVEFAETSKKVIKDLAEQQ
ncbi:SRPBCC domain-containing protein [Alkalihalobacillus sp. MEB130]|uniref:SRPBCC family protein n=1 Tax=Alkalihalobacillus sp. MEB130 TaxID=2976704 RepID=UPI0028DD5E44|nr:SRPBCC domain-containing protein [Alkalihalobacillus sp. MEB130]MDT8860381.1 SRPBCC domain-containing protein [Alkalihalobacillus sp. MEB130]